jgi:phosphoribosylaminoimidazolecarboxamide formyltransferase/IMP cyclohydrolase
MPAETRSSPDLVPIRRALLSVSDKSGLVELARALHAEFDVELLSTGGTARTLRDAGMPVTDVSEVTGFPEMMAGRVKTLHPKVHGALLARLPEDEAVMQEEDITPIDLVVVNLYSFEETIADPDVTYAEAIEKIDIGGPSMIRSAAKNHARVTVVTQPGQYDELLEAMHESGGATGLGLRRRLAAAAFSRTFAYDGAISAYLEQQAGLEGAFETLDPDTLGHDHIAVGAMTKKLDLRYGENPHQRATFYAHETDRPPAGLADFTQLHGKALGYINLLDADAALAVVREFETPACCIVKHATPCGVGIGTTAAMAFDAAHASDPLAAFGGIVAFNTAIDDAAAAKLCEGEKFLEVIVAPEFADAAAERLRGRWKNVRLLSVGSTGRPTGIDALSFHPVHGGLLVQERDLVGVVDNEWQVVSDRQPSETELTAMRFNWLACKHVKSNAVVIGGANGTYGIGGGQVDRVAAAEQAVCKAGDRARNAVAASDAFFPFADGPQALLDAGVTAIVQPGGSKRDQDTIDLVNKYEATMVFTGRRHFRH